MKPTIVNPEYQSHVEFLDLTSDWLRQHKDQLDWTNVCRYQKLEQSFIEQMDQYVNWIAVSKWQLHLSQDFIRKNWDKLNKPLLSRHTTFSESFLREFKDEIDWEMIIHTQKISINIMREFRDILPWDFIYQYQEQFKYSFCDKYEAVHKQFDCYRYI